MWGARCIKAKQTRIEILNAANLLLQEIDVICCVKNSIQECALVSKESGVQLFVRWQWDELEWNNYIFHLWLITLRWYSIQKLFIERMKIVKRNQTLYGCLFPGNGVEKERGEMILARQWPKNHVQTKIYLQCWKRLFMSKMREPEQIKNWKKNQLSGNTRRKRLSVHN